MTAAKLKITKRNLFETALVLLFADFVWMYWGFQQSQLIVGVVLLILALLVPKVFYPIAWGLMFMAKLLSKFVPLVFLSVIFYVLVTPMAVIRRVLGRDSLKLNEFKQSENSVFVERNEIIKADDILHPY